MIAHTDHHYQEMIYRQCAFNLLYVTLVIYISLGCLSIIVGLIYFFDQNADTGKIYLAFGGACLGVSIMFIHLYIRALRFQQQHDQLNPVVDMGIPVAEPVLFDVREVSNT
jgi:hypothetical protein